MQEKRASKRKSVYWNHFAELSGDYDEMRRKVRCEHCYKLMAIGPNSTGNMARHLRAKHPDIMKMIQEGNGMDVTETQTHTEVEYETEDGHKFKEFYIVQPDDELEVVEKAKPPKQKSRQKSQKISFKNMSLIEPTPLREEEQEDRFDIFGKLVAMKMRGLDNHQRILAEKIINDALHEAEISSWNQNNRTTAVQTEENPLADEFTDDS